MRKILLLGAVACISLTAMAADFPTLTFEMTDGSFKTLDSENLSMTFQDGNLLATNKDGVFQAPVSGISKFYFSSGAQAVDGIEADAGSKVNVFSTTGVFMGSFDSIETARTSLSPGLYIMRTGSKNFKTVVK